jgi:hypothetical protein
VRSDVPWPQTPSGSGNEVRVLKDRGSVFWLFGILAFGLIVLVPFMKRSVAEKGEHVGAE